MAELFQQASPTSIQMPSTGLGLCLEKSPLWLPQMPAHAHLCCQIWHCRYTVTTNKSQLNDIKCGYYVITHAGDSRGMGRLISCVCLTVLVRALCWAISDPYYQLRCRSVCLFVCLSVCLFVCPVFSPVHPLPVDRFSWNLVVRTHLGPNLLLWSFSPQRPLAAELWTKNIKIRGVAPNATPPTVLNLGFWYFGTMESSVGCINGPKQNFDLGLNFKMAAL